MDWRSPLTTSLVIDFDKARAPSADRCLFFLTRIPSFGKPKKFQTPKEARHIPNLPVKSHIWHIQNSSFWVQIDAPSVFFKECPASTTSPDVLNAWKTPTVASLEAR